MLRSFRDRNDAGRQLAALIHARGFEQPVLLGISVGGLLIASEMKSRLDGEIGFIAVNRVCTPRHFELTIGAVTGNDPKHVYHVLSAGEDDAFDDLDLELEAQAGDKMNVALTFTGGLTPRINARPVIIVDDGTTSLIKVRAAIRSIRELEASHTMFTMPVGQKDVVERIRQLADRVICLHEVPDFQSVGRSYVDFRSIDEDIMSTALMSVHEFETLSGCCKSC